MKLKSLKNLVDAEDFKILGENSTNGKISISILPEEIYVVPSFATPTHDNPLPYIHIRNQKCPLTTCKEKKSKLRVLIKKDAPPCIHTVLTHAISGKLKSTTQQRSSSTPVPGTSTTPQVGTSSTPLAGPSSSVFRASCTSATSAKVKNPKINRELTIKLVVHNISLHFPTMSKITSTDFVNRSRMYVEKLVSSDARNRTIEEHSRKFCTSCTKKALEDWPFKPKHAYLLSLGHLVKIEIPVKFCRKCKRLFYPGKKENLVIQIALYIKGDQRN